MSSCSVVAARPLSAAVPAILILAMAATPVSALIPNIRLTIDPASSVRPRVALDPQSNVVVVWQDGRFGNDEILWQKFDQLGSPLTAVVRVTNTAGASRLPDVSCDANGVSHVTWQEGENVLSVGSVYLCRLDAAGTKILSDIQVAASYYGHPRIAALADGSTDLTFFRSSGVIDFYTLYRRYSPAGAQVCAKQLGSSFTATVLSPTIATNSDGVANVFWLEIPTYSYEVRSGSVAACGTPSIQAIGGAGSTTRTTTAIGGSNLYRMFDAGGNIQNVLAANNVCQISQGLGQASAPSVGADANDGYVVWRDNRDAASGEIYFARFWSCTNRSGDVRLTNDPATSVEPDIAVDPAGSGNWVATWRDTRDGNNEIYLTSRMLIDGPTPTAPTNLTAALTPYPPRASLEWEDRSTNETGFEIDMEIDNSGVWQPQTTVGAGISAWVSDPLAPGRTYAFRVRACNGADCSAYSNEAPVDVQFTIMASADPHGSITPSGEVSVARGASQTFTITPGSCYSIMEVLVDGVSVGAVPTYPFTNVTADHTIAATFDFSGQHTADDSDGDGLPDSWETAGIPIDGTTDTYRLPGADPLHKDLYVEADAMIDHAPDADALSDVVAAFGQAPVCNPDQTSGVHLHIVGAACDPCVDESNLTESVWPTWSPSNEPAIWSQIHALKTARFGTAAERAAPDAVSRATAKAKGFRYCIFGKSIGGPSGIAEGGGDFAVTLDPSWFNNISRDKWAGTFMHEFGHSLGLGHGGSDGVTADGTNAKPNYYSVMNYLWQWPVAVNGQGLDWNSAYRNSWVLDYSRSPLNVLDEGGLSELAGIGGDATRVVPIGPPHRSAINLNPWFKLVPMGGAVDWNDDGTRGGSGVVARDINYFELPGQTPGLPPDRLKPREDWSVLKYKPTETFPPSAVALQTIATSLEDVESEMTQAMFDAVSSLHFDCNDNEVEDAEEILNGAVADVNGNGIPDPCEGPAILVAVGEAPPPPPGLSMTMVPRGTEHEIRYSLPVQAQTRLSVFDLKGRFVVTLVDGDAVAGAHHVVWGYVDASGHGVSSGVYFVELQSGSRRAQGKIVVLR